MTPDSVNGILRAVVPAILAYVAGRGWISSTSIPDIMAAVLALSAAFWSYMSNRPAAIVAKVNALPAVAGVVTTATPEGKELALSVPSSTVATAGSTAAANIAAK